MASPELEARVEELRADYASVRRQPFKDFFCPFLYVDERTELCKGHIVNDAFGTCAVWEPQRKDFDNFYGKIEADFIGVVQNHAKSALDKFVDPKANSLYNPQLMFGTETLEHYFDKKAKPPPGHTSVVLLDTSGEKLCNFVVKKSSDELKELHGKDIQIVAAGDHRPAIIASVLKTAHLTMFHMLGYNHVFSAGGDMLAHILRDFYLKHRNTKKKDLGDDLTKYFRPHECLISPAILNNKEVFSGTVFDNRLMAAIGKDDGMFAIGVLVPAGAEAFCVWLPADSGKTIDTYLGFLKEPPPSIAVRPIQFCPTGEHGPYWATPKGDNVRIPLPERLLI